MIQVRRIFLGLAIAALPMLAGCSSSSTSSPPPPAASFVYYSTNFSNTVGTPQLGVTAYPIIATSTLLTTLNASVANGLTYTENLAVDGAGRLFVVNETTPNTVGVFTLPLTATSTPSIVLTLPAAITGAFGIAFDASGNMWIADTPNDTVTEFTGPFTASATLVAAVTMVSPPDPNGIAFDAAGNLWVALDEPTFSVGEYVKPGGGFVNSTIVTNFLDGLADADSIAFDHSGNLYSGGDPPNGPKKQPAGRHRSIQRAPGVRPAVAELDGIGFWPPANQVNNGVPTIVNNTGLLTGFFSYQIAFDAAGNLYDADCGTTGQIYVYPTATNAWSATLAPVLYTDANITTAVCAAGIAIH